MGVSVESNLSLHIEEKEDNKEYTKPMNAEARKIRSKWSSIVFTYTDGKKALHYLYVLSVDK